MKYYNEILNQALQADFFFDLLKYDIFSKLDEWISAPEFAKKLGLTIEEAELFLECLQLNNWLEVKNQQYRCKAELGQIYSRQSKFCLSSTLLAQYRANRKRLGKFFEKLNPAEEIVQTEKTFKPEGGLDFRSFFERSRIEVELFRGPSLLEICQRYPLAPDAKILDLGGGCGALGEVLADGKRELSLFDSPEVIAAVENPAFQQLIAGDFNRDSWGGPYDLILASGILDFVDFQSKKFFDQLSRALKPSAYVFFYWLSFDPELAGIKALRWLPERLSGRVLPDLKTVESALEANGLKQCEIISDTLYPLAIYQKKA
ncbi:MAG: methyltransferase [Eubacteriales bacterium]|nr:methyltransferase [Eubacteriales bacterium]